MRFYGGSVVFGMLVLFGAVTLCGAAVEFLLRDVFEGFLALAGSGMEFGFGLRGLSRTKPDVFTFDREALKIRRMWKNSIVDPSIPWDSVERITVEHEPQDTEFGYSVVAWFRPDREPSYALLRKFGGRQRLDSSCVVYRSGRWHCDGVPASRLNEAFPVYAGHRYVDKTGNSPGR